jgi:hypothetical protein
LPPRKEVVISHLVELDDDVFHALQERALPLIDDVNSVLRRILELEGSAEPRPALGSTADTPKHTDPRSKRRKTATRTKARGPRAERGSLLPEAEYEVPLLSALVERGGSAPASHVIEDVGDSLGDRLSEVDRQVLNSGLVRWKNRVQFVRLKLIQSGDMAAQSPRGVWEITETGRARVENNGARG